MVRTGNRIGALAAAVTFALCLATGPASAQNCDSRIPGNCPNAPMEATDTVSESPSEPLKITRSGKPRSAKRERTSSRKARAAERRKVAKTRKRAPVVDADEAEEAAAPPLPTAKRAKSAKSDSRTDSKSDSRFDSDATQTIAAPADDTASLPETMSKAGVVDGALAAGAKLDMGWSGAPLPSSGFVAPGTSVGATSSGRISAGETSAGETTGQAIREPQDQVAADIQPQAPVQQAQLTTPAKMAVASAQEPTETPWLRLAFIGVAGLLAFGSAIRLFV